jgi:hypothetical protein
MLGTGFTEKFFLHHLRVKIHTTPMKPITAVITPHPVHLSITVYISRWVMSLTMHTN